MVTRVSTFSVSAALSRARAAASNPAAGFAKAPTHSAGRGIFERVSNLVGANRRFHATGYDAIDKRPDRITSPVQGRLVAKGEIGRDMTVVSKHGKLVCLDQLLGEHADLFSGGFYMNIHLRPWDRHYWRAPFAGEFVSTHAREGESWLPVFIGLESLFKKADLFPQAVRANASIGSVLDTGRFPIGMVAVGSLFVNEIHTLYDEGVRYEKDDLVGFFNLGSTMLLAFPDYPLYPVIGEGDKVDIGDAIVGID